MIWIVDVQTLGRRRVVEIYICGNESQCRAAGRLSYLIGHERGGQLHRVVSPQSMTLRQIHCVFDDARRDVDQNGTVGKFSFESVDRLRGRRGRQRPGTLSLRQRSHHFDARDARQVKTISGGGPNKPEHPVRADLASVPFDQRAAIEKKNGHLLAVLQNRLRQSLSGNGDRHEFDFLLVDPAAGDLAD